LVAGCQGGKVQFWDAAKGTARGEPLNAGGEVCTLAFSSDGKLLAVACEDNGFKGHAQLWDAATHQAHGPPLPHSKPVFGAAFLPEGKKLVTASAAGMFCWDTNTQQLLAKFAEDRSWRYVAFSRDGRKCAIGGSDRSVHFSNGSSMDRPLGLPIWHSHQIGPLLFTPDGDSLLTSSWGDCVREWEVPRLREQTVPFPNKRPSAPRLNTWGGIRDGLRCLAISSDGKRLLAADWDRSARLWDLDSGRPLNFVLGHDDVVLAACFDASGRVILTGSADHSARLWDGATGKPIGVPWKLKGPVMTVALSRDGQTAFTGVSLSHYGKNDSAQLWDVATGQPLRKVNDSAGNMSAAAFSCDGKVLWTGTWQVLEQWDVAASTQPRIHFAAHMGAITTIALSPDGEMIATSSQDKTVRLWASATGKPLGLPLVHKGVVQQVAFSLDGKLVVTACLDGKAQVWDVATGKSVGPALDHPLPVHAANFTPDGKWIITRSEEPFLRRWKAPGLVKGDVQRIVLWTQVLTGMELDVDGAVHTLDIDEWRLRRQQLEALGGSPAPAAEASLSD
jgi:WD40 repeat protein